MREAVRRERYFQDQPSHTLIRDVASAVDFPRIRTGLTLNSHTFACEKQAKSQRRLRTTRFAFRWEL